MGRIWEQGYGSGTYHPKMNEHDSSSLLVSSCRKVAGIPNPNSPSLIESTSQTSEAIRPPSSSIHLRKEIGLVSGVGMIFGNVIGAGIFITTSGILGHTNSFGLTLVTWVAGGIIALMGALCYCELGTMIKKSGSEYAYIMEAYSFGRKNGLRTVGSMLGFVNVWYDALVGNPLSHAISLLVFGRYMCRPFFINCSHLPVLPTKMFALAALSKFIPLVFSDRTTCIWPCQIIDFVVQNLQVLK